MKLHDLDNINKESANSQDKNIKVKKDLENSENRIDDEIQFYERLISETNNLK